MNDTILGLPVNRFVTFIKPLINLAAGVVAALVTALLIKLGLLDVVGVDQAELVGQIAIGLTFLVTTGLTQLADLKWIKGHHIELEDGAIAIRDEEEALDEVLTEVERTPTDDVTTVPPDQGDAGRP